MAVPCNTIWKYAATYVSVSVIMLHIHHTLLIGDPFQTGLCMIDQMSEGGVQAVWIPGQIRPWLCLQSLR